MDRPPTIAVDLDGVIYKQDGWKRFHLGQLIPGVVDELQKFKDAGWKVVIHTARIPEDFDYVRLQLIKDGVPHHRIWDNIGKPLADVYLDDRGITFEGHWEGMFERVLDWNPWYGDKFLRPPVGSEDEDLIGFR